METYFAESAKNCEQQSFAPVNQILISEASTNGI